MEARIRYPICADAPSAAILPIPRPASAFRGENSAPDTFARGFFHWNVGVAPLYCRKAATKGLRLLRAAADVFFLLGRAQRQL
jgi:hypothetical protein